MRKKVSLFLLILIVGNIFATTGPINFWERVNNFEYSSFLEEYNELDQSSINPIIRGKLAYALYLTGGREPSWLEVAATDLEELLVDGSVPEDQIQEITYLLANSYLNLIIDAKSYMSYSSKYEDKISKCIGFDPDNVLYNICSAQGMMWFPSSRGDFEDGLNILVTLETKNPNNSDVLLAISQYRLGENRVDDAERGFKRILEINGKNQEAIDVLDSINLSRKELEIRNISIITKTKTSEERLLKKVSGFIGKTLTLSVKSDIAKEITQVSSIGGGIVKGYQINDQYVDIEISVAEDNTRAIIILEKGAVGLDYSNDILPDGLPPVFVYIDNNILGSGSSLKVYSALIFNKFDFTMPGIIDDRFLDLKLSITSMALPVEFADYENGERTESTKKSSFHSAKIGLGRFFPIGLRVYTYYQSQWNFYEDLSGMITPGHFQTHTVTGEFVLDIAGEVLTPFDTLNGFRFMFLPQWTYKTAYEAWGDPTNLYKHDNSPSLVFRTKAGYYNNLTEKHNISLEGTWLINSNPYETDRFRLGHSTTAMTEEFISGYLPGELVFDNGIFTNIKYTLMANPNKFNLYAKYDVLFDIDSSKLFNGIALGTTIKLAWDIDITGELGLGLNVNRESGPGFQLSIGIQKIIIL